MVQVTYPGVYVQEISSGFRAISGVATSIAAFVGMTKRGPLRTPVRVLGLKDYERIFSSDSSQGELTEQVRQFFINGGNEAIIVRVADDADPSTVTLLDEDGANSIRLDSIDAGLDSNQIRASVDYNTSSPDRTFNLTIFRETFDANGAPIVSEAEVHRNLEMDPGSPRFVQTIVNQSSLLATATNLSAAPTAAAFSASSRYFAGAAAVLAALNGEISATEPGSLRIKVGNSPWLTVLIPDGAFAALTELTDPINAALGSHTTVTVAAAVTGGLLRLTASDDSADVLIDSGTENDVTAVLGLGVNQGGIEVGSFGTRRPAPSGLVSRLDAGADILGALINLGAMDKDTITAAGVGAVRPFSAVIDFPATNLMNEGTVPGGSLRNVQENMQFIANAMSAASNDWDTTVHGHRLVITPTFGGSASGPGVTFVSTPDLAAANQIFNSVAARRAGFALGGGDDGNVAKIADYTAAYQIIDERVDLFNLLLLPKSAGDTASPSIRSTLWGPASSFCQRKRAFLIADLEPTATTPDAVVAAIKKLRIGLVKDHTGAWWPPVAISPAGALKNIDPCGSVAGIMARIDGSRGVWKAPAGLDSDVRGALGVAVPMSNAQNGVMNPEAVNAVRVFPAGVVSWGARTVDGFEGSGNTDYRYVPVRRLALNIEESLYRGLQFAVFEPNDEPLWGQIRLAAGAFMNNLFRQGAFAGRTSDLAYFVKADAETTTPLDQALGIVNVLIGFAPLRPAEFVVITIQQMAGQVQV